MLDYQEYIIDEDEYQGDGDGYHGNGYDKLDGDYALFYKVAKGFTHRVSREDTHDFLHDLLLAMAKVKASYTAKGKELTEGGLVRVAQYQVAQYWRKWYHRNNGIDCSQCSQAQKDKCKDWFLYPDCPKAVKLERLDRIVEDGNGGETALHELIADDNAVDCCQSAKWDTFLTEHFGIVRRCEQAPCGPGCSFSVGYPFVSAPPFYASVSALSCRIRRRLASRRRAPCGSGGCCSNRRSRQWPAPVGWADHRVAGSPLVLETAGSVPPYR